MNHPTCGVVLETTGDQTGHRIHPQTTGDDMMDDMFCGENSPTKLVTTPRAPGPYPQVRWLDPPGTHPNHQTETEVGQEPKRDPSFTTNYRFIDPSPLGTE